MGLFEVPWRDDFSIGTGISDFSGLPAPKPWALDDGCKKELNCDASPPHHEPHGNVSVTKGIMSNTSLYKYALEASTSLSVKLWGSGVNASSKLLTELEIDERTAQYMVVSKFVTESVNKLDSLDKAPTLSSSAKDRLVKIGPKKWAEEYGTHFVAGYVRGGAYLGKATITDHSTGGAHEFRAGMGAKFGSFASGGAEGGVAFGHLKVSCTVKMA